MTTPGTNLWYPRAIKLPGLGLRLVRQPCNIAVFRLSDTVRGTVNLGKTAPNLLSAGHTHIRPLWLANQSGHQRAHTIGFINDDVFSPIVSGAFP